MVKSFADYYGIDAEVFDSTGAFDPILSIDTRLFIDPGLLRDTTIPEMKSSYEKISTYFSEILQVVSSIGGEGDRLWREADKRLQFPEVKGICIGYSKNGTSGSGMGPKLRKQLLSTIVEIVRAGVSNPSLFELVGAFEDDIGPDRISDMVAKIIIEDLVTFTQRVCSDCGIKMESLPYSKDRLEEDLPANPVTGGPVILVPRELLRDLPVAESFTDIAYVAAQNQRVRDELNRIIGDSWKKATVADKKLALRTTFINNPDVLAKILEDYRNSKGVPYDFSEDRSGEAIWYKTAKNAVKIRELKLKLSEAPDVDEVFDVVKQICTHYRNLLEDNQLCKLLYDKHDQKKHESAAQLLFFGIASAYCEANRLDLSPEADSGRGPVDFKVSSGFDGRVLVEIKLTSNQQLVHGFEKQLPIYQKAEANARGIYLVIDNGGASDDRLQRFWQKVRDAGESAPKVIFVDGIPRPSASRAEK